MKKRMTALLLCAALMACLLAGCGGSAKSEAVMHDMAAPMEAPEAAGENKYSADSVLTNGSGTNASVTNQKLIKRVTINAETEDLQGLLPQLTEKITELGGYVQTQELYNGKQSVYYSSRSLNMTVRIPAERLSEFTGQVEGISNVVSYSETAEDVTLQYVDTESRVKALQVEQERLLELIAKAEDMETLLKIQDRLTDVRYELERYASQLRLLDNQVNFATVYLYITQVEIYTEVEPQSVGQRISSGFSGNLKDIGEGLTDFFVWAMVYSPQLLFWAAVIALAVALLRRKGKKVRIPKMPMKKPEEEQEK